MKRGGVRRIGPPYMRWGLWIWRGSWLDITLGIHMSGKPYFSVWLEKLHERIISVSRRDVLLLEAQLDRGERVPAGGARGAGVTTSVTVKNHGPGMVTVRSHYLDENHKPTGSYHGQDIPPDKDHTFVLHRGVQLTVDEIVPGRRTV